MTDQPEALRAQVLASPRLTVVDHPMVQHKLAILRDRETSSKQFRELVREIALFEGYEATRDFPLREVSVETLRAGLGMVEGILDLVPAARVGHIGLFRDPETHEPHTYYCKLPADVDQRTCLLVDPMLATGGSAVAAIRYLREAGVKDVRLLCIIAAPEGVDRILEADPDVQLYVAAVDDRLNDQAYIVPGLGDAGDRIFGTL